MKYFLYKLIPPRETFPKDMTEVDSSVGFRIEIYQMHEPILRK
jgi:hypothetical protein